jgi:hypothetical protein
MEKNKFTKKKKAVVLIGCLLIVVIVAVVVWSIHMSKKDEGKSDSDSKETGYHELKDGENPEDVEVQVKTSEDYVEPAPGTLEIEKIQGYTAKTTTSSDDAAEDPLAEGETSGSGISLSDQNLKVESIGGYAGSFLEDGSDEPMANVAAMLLTNQSEQMLQIAEIDFQVNETETAHFKVTDLPAGTSVLVLESNRREFREEDNYSYGDAATGYMEQPSLEEDKFEVMGKEGKIILKNKTQKTYQKVYIYYKYVQLGGAYLGGITYRTPFENVAGGAEVEAVAVHFNPESSKIMAVQVLEE